MTPVNRSRMTVVILSIVVSMKLAVSEIVVPPKDIDAIIGTSITFYCSSSILEADVQWVHYPIDKTTRIVYGYGKFGSQYGKRFTLVDGYNLHISSVIVDDAGTYECHDDYGQGEKRNAELIILESKPVCRSDSNSDKIVGKNTCGIEPGQLTLSCSVQFQGKKAPTLEWKKNGEEKTITSGVSSETQVNRVLQRLSLKGDSITNGSSYNCRSTNAATNEATCNSSVVTIIGNFAATSHYDCASSKNYIVAITFICIIALLLFIILCLYVFFKRKEKKRQDPKINRLEAEKEVLISRLEEHEPPEKVKYADKPDLVLTITTNDPLKKRQVIRGLAVLGNELFVAFRNSSEIEVYNTVTHQLERILQLPNIKELYDLTAGKTDNCLFAIILTKQTEGRRVKKEDRNDLRQEETNDATDEESNGMIHMEIVAEDMQKQKEECVIMKFDTKGNLLHPWSKPLGSKYGKLSTCESNIVACFNTRCVIKEFSRDGDLIHEVPLPRSVGISLYSHAIKVTRMHFAVSYGLKEDERQGICLIDLNGNIRMECRGLEKETPASYNRPIHFVEGSDRSLLVADQMNSRILLLDWNLKFRRILIQLGGLQFPNRLCFDETQSKLFVSIHSGVDDKGMVEYAGVRVYNIK